MYLAHWPISRQSQGGEVGFDEAEEASAGDVAETYGAESVADEHAAGSE
jgi:hypothetical protein